MLTLLAGPAIAEPTRKPSARAEVPVERRLDDIAQQIRSMCLPVDPPTSSVVRLPTERES